MLVYTTQVNSTFRARWLASSEVISQVLFTSEQPKKNKMAFVGTFSQIKLLFGPLVIQLVWYQYTKTIIHLSVILTSPLRGSVNIHHYSPPLRWIIVNYSDILKHKSKMTTDCWLFKYLWRSVACRTGGLAGPARYTSARVKRENEREAPSQNYPPVVTPLFMLFQPLARRTVCADWLVYITWSSDVFPRRNTTTYSDLNQQQIDSR